jgi:hypothetical protein
MHVFPEILASPFIAEQKTLCGTLQQPGPCITWKQKNGSNRNGIVDNNADRPPGKPKTAAPELTRGSNP